MTFTASMLVTIAYAIDRGRGRGDYGGWVHIVAAVCAAIALINLFNAEQGLRHLLLPTSIAAMASSLFLGRIVWLVVGLGALFTYLMWLAREVFERAVAFPVILAAVGFTVILVTVWVQRTYPRIAARVRESGGAVAQFPGGAALLLAPALVAVLVMPAAREAARWEEERWQAEAARARVIERRTARPPARPRGLGDDVPVVPRPRDSVTVSPPDTSSAAPRDSVSSLRDTVPLPRDTVPVAAPPDSLPRA
jgi:hypothetical protein